MRARALAWLRALLIVGTAIGGAGAGAQDRAGEMELRPSPGDQPPAAESGSLLDWADDLLNLLPDAAAPLTESCTAATCPPGLVCCCCEGVCRCKRECSLRPCR